MAQLKNFVFCLNTGNSEDKNDLFGILAAITPEYIPGLFSFSVFFSLMDLSEGIHDLNLIFKDDTGEEVANIGSAKVDYQNDASNNLPDQYKGLNVAVNLQNVNLKRSGLYTMEVLLDGIILQTNEIFVQGKNCRE